MATPFSKLITKKRAELERDLRRQGKEEDQIIKIVAEWEKQFAAQREAKVSAAAEQRREQQSQPGLGGKLRSVGGSLGATALNLGNRATFGALPGVAGAIAGPAEQERTEVDIEAARRVNPTASLAGDIGAFFTPGSPLKRVVGGAGRLLSRPLGNVAAADKVAQSIVARSTAQIGANLSGATGSIAATNLTQADTDATLGDRLNRTMAQAGSPLNLVLSVGTGAAQGALRSRVNTERKTLVDEAKRLLGPKFEATPDLLRTGGEIGPFSVGRILGNIAHLPIGRNIAARYMRRAVWGPMDESLKTLQGKYGSRTTARTTEVAGRAVKAIAGAGAGTGRIERRRQGINAAAFRAEGTNQITPEAQRLMVRSISKFLTDLRPQEKGRLSPQMTKAIGQFRRTIVEASKANRRIDVQDVENFRQIIADIGKLGAKTGSLSKIDTRLANAVYSSITETFRLSAPRVDQARQAAVQLHAAREAMPKVAMSDPPEALRKIFTTEGATGRWRDIVKFSSQEEVQKIRGWFASQYINHVAGRGPDGSLVNLNAINRLEKGGSSMFRPDLVDEVLPGLRQELTTLGRISDLIARGIGKAEGAQTGGRLSDAALIGSVATAPILAWYLIQGVGREEAGLAALGQIGASVFVSSLVGGRSARGLNALASGQAVAGPTSGAAALQQLVGGTP